MGGDLVRLEQLLDVLVKLFLAEAKDEHLREAQFSCSSHVVLNLFLQGNHVAFVVKLHPVRFSDSDTEITGTFDKTVVDIVGGLVVVSAVTCLVSHDPLAVTKVDCFLDRQASHHILVDMDDLVLLEDLGLGENSLISKIDRTAINTQVPVTKDLLLREKTN